MIYDNANHVLCELNKITIKNLVVWIKSEGFQKNKRRDAKFIVKN